MTTRPISRTRRRRRARTAADYLFGSPAPSSVRLVHGLLPLIELLDAQGHAVEPILAHAEIPRFALEEPGYRIQGDQEIKFTRRALERLKVPAAGLVVGQRYDVARFGVVGLAASRAPNLREFLRTTLSYPSLAWGPVELSVWREDAEETLVLEEISGLGDCGPFFMERDLTVTLAVLHSVFGPQLRPTCVRFRHMLPPDLDAYAAFFGCKVEFGAATNEIRFARHLWDTTSPQADARAYRFLESQCRSTNEVLLKPLNYADIVRSRLRSATPIPSLPDLAATLYLTERTLQRRLESENTSYSAVLKEVRVERAQELLDRTDLILREIASHLGFMDADTFSRAFKEWTGISPTQHRNRR
ncbi:MAG: AraC family transcriptional regulator [Gammaproteobacteria bacterium]|nr:AraC family transcriptional regulator [Gammaproteobacteria bacterium]